MEEKEKNKRIRDLLYLETQLINMIHEDIESTLRGKPRENIEIKDSLLYRIDEILRCNTDF